MDLRLSFRGGMKLKAVTEKAKTACNCILGDEGSYLSSENFISCIPEQGQNTHYIIHAFGDCGVYLAI